MRISRRKNRARAIQQQRFDPKAHRRNDFIRTPQVRLIDENGENIGVIDTSAALAMARERGFDLIEVSPLANPPVAKILDFAKFKYEEEKERRKERAKQKKVELKAIRLSLRIGEHDREVRLKQAEGFLEDGDKVRIELQLRGRENQHAQLAKEVVNNFIKVLETRRPLTIEAPLAYMGGKISILIANK